MTHLATNLTITASFLLEKTFDEIQTEIKNGYIRKARHPKFPNLEIYNYTDKCTYDGHWTPTTKMCRGLVVDTSNREIIIYCIPKFFNEGELYAEKVDKHNAIITLKEDGYMCQYTYHDKYGLIVTSRGSFDSKYANYVYDFLRDKVKTIDFGNGRLSFMLELCKDFPGDETTIVTRHPKDRVVCWTAVDILGQEIDRNTIKKCLPEGIELVREFSLDEATKYLTSEVEGVVVRSKELFRGGLSAHFPRVKVKTDWFLERHRLIADCTKKRVWELIRDGGKVEDLEGLPDEFMKQMIDWEKEIRAEIEQMYREAHSYAHIYESYTDKELGLENPIPKPYNTYVWCIRKDKEQECLNLIIQEIGRKLKTRDTIDT